MILQGNVIKALNDFIVRTPSKYVTFQQNLVAIGTEVWEYNNFSLFRDLLKLRDQSVIWLYLMPFKVSHHPTKFGGHKPASASDDIKFLICHVIS